MGVRRFGIAAIALFVLGVNSVGFGSNLTQGMIGGALVGLGMNGKAVRGDGILGQIIDRDAEKMGVRREALFYSVLPVPARLSTVLSSLVFALLTPLFGYVSGEQPGAQPGIAFRYYMTIFPVLALLAAIFIARGYREQHGEENRGLSDLK